MKKEESSESQTDDNLVAANTQQQQGDETSTSECTDAQAASDDDPQTRTTLAKSKKAGHVVSFKCELCLVSCVNQDIFEAHLKGQKHQRKLIRKQEMERSGRFDAIVNSSRYCKLCCVELTSSTHMSIHLSGKKHRQTLARSMAGKPAEEVASVQKELAEIEQKQKRCEEELIERANITDWTKFAIPADKKTGNSETDKTQYEYFCSVCNKFFVGKTQLAMHVLSIKHRSKTRSGGRMFTPRSHSTSYRRRQPFSSDDNAISHYSSPYYRSHHQSYGSSYQTPERVQSYSRGDFTRDISSSAALFSRLSRNTGSSPPSNYNYQMESLSGQDTNIQYGVLGDAVIGTYQYQPRTRRYNQATFLPSSVMPAQLMAEHSSASCNDYGSYHNTPSALQRPQLYQTGRRTGADVYGDSMNAVSYPQVEPLSQTAYQAEQYHNMGFSSQAPSIYHSEAGMPPVCDVPPSMERRDGIPRQWTSQFSIDSLGPRRLTEDMPPVERGWSNTQQNAADSYNQPHQMAAGGQLRQQSEWMSPSSQSHYLDSYEPTMDVRKQYGSYFGGNPQS